MELRHLEYFAAVVEEAGFTKAAARLHIAQSGVSAQIRQLERELGQALLDRSTRQVGLTEVGAAILPYVRSVLDTVESIRVVVDEHVGLLRGRLALGTVTSASEGFDLPGLLAGFHRQHPAVEISLVEATSDRLIAAVHDTQLDAAVISPGEHFPSELDVQVIADEPLVVVMPREHALARSSEMRLSELAGQPLISFPRDAGPRSDLEQACAAAGFEPMVVFEASDPKVLVRLAAADLGVAIVPAPFAVEADHDLSVVAISEPPLRARLALAWRSGAPLSPATRALIGHLRRDRND